MTEPDGATPDATGVDVDPDPNEALVEPAAGDVPDDTPDPDVAEVTDPDDPSFVEPAATPEGVDQ